MAWGYRGAFEQMTEALQKANPGLTIEGETYPVSWIRRKIAQIFGYFTMFTYAIIFLGPLTDLLGISDIDIIKTA